MGCMHSKSQRPSAFKVEFRAFHRHFPLLEHYNDDEVCYGILSIRDTEMVLRKMNTYHSIVWPLKTIRRYGFQDDMFCFEVGRLSLTGQGVFALKCEDAELVFETFKIALKAYNATCMSKDMAHEIRNFTSVAGSNKLEKMYSSDGSPNNNGESQCAMLEADSNDLPQSPFVNILFEKNINYFNNLAAASKSIDSLTYIELEKGFASKKPKPVEPAEKSVYTSIDFFLTMRMSQKMFRCTDNTGVRKTRHDFIEDSEPKDQK